MTYQQLTLEERTMIYGFCKVGFSISDIALELNRDKSTISRELKRNKGQRGYRPKQAHELSVTRKKSSYKHRKWCNKLEKLVIYYLTREWSPEQISERLKNDKKAIISHEKIYQFIEEDKTNGGILYTHLRQGKKKRRKKYGKNASKRGQIQNRVSIKDRPVEINDRSVYGHWEGDTIIGKNHKRAMITLVERKHGFSIIEKVHSKNAEVVAKRIIKSMKKYKDSVKSITFDNGLEFANHEMIAKKLNCKIYFADPYSSYQRGTNENTNGLIRQYFPKGSNFDNFTDIEIKRVMRKLNNRPRKRLDYFSPMELFKNRTVALNS